MKTLGRGRVAHPDADGRVGCGELECADAERTPHVADLVCEIAREERERGETQGRVCVCPWEGEHDIALQAIARRVGRRGRLFRDQRTVRG